MPSDRDGDGIWACTPDDLVGTCDCDDDDPDVNPGVQEDITTIELCGDGIDQNCDGMDALCGAGCALPCADGTICCFGECVNVAVDADSCGACGATCPISTTDRCIDATCDCAGEPDIGPCPASSACCADGCADLENDVDNCGRCGLRCRDAVVTEGGITFALADRADSCVAGECGCGGAPHCRSTESCVGGVCVDRRR
jgi:hypothetical protein